MWKIRDSHLIFEVIYIEFLCVHTILYVFLCVVVGYYYLCIETQHYTI